MAPETDDRGLHAPDPRGGPGAPSGEPGTAGGWGAPPGAVKSGSMLERWGAYAKKIGAAAMIVGVLAGVTQTYVEHRQAADRNRPATITTTTERQSEQGGKADNLTTMVEGVNASRNRPGGGDHEMSRTPAKHLEEARRAELDTVLNSMLITQRIPPAYHSRNG